MAATGVLILGGSGTGKSCSLRNFKNDDVSIINVSGKRLPFRGSDELKKMVVTDDYQDIIKLMANSSSRSIVIDDSQYIMANEYMKKALDKGFDKFTLIGRHFWDIIESLKRLPVDVIVYFLHHIDIDDNGNIKAKTQGRLIDNHICLEGMFSIVLRSFVDNGKYGFYTQNQGNDTVKSPMGMFDSLVIDNDLKNVDNCIREYYGI